MLKNEHGQEIKILVKAPSVMENSRTEQRGELLWDRACRGGTA